MLEDPIRLLAFNGGAQVLASSLLGWGMLVPMQPWGQALRERLNAQALLAVHLDLYMLAFMQWGAAFMMDRWSNTASLPVAWLLIFGGWMNPVPYLLRGFGIHAFAFAGGTTQRLWAALAAASALCITIAWVLLLARL